MMKHRTAAALAFCLVALPAAAAPKAGEAAPDFVGKTSDDKPILISDYQGKVVVLSFWATWCGPCRKELPILEGIQKTAGRERIQVVAVNVEDGDTFRRLAPKMASLQLLVGSDAANEAQRAYGVNGIPHMVIIDKAGRILRVNRGYSEAGVDDVVRDLNQALAR